MPNQFFSPEGDLENYFVTDYWLIDQYVGAQLWVWGLTGTLGAGFLGNAQISGSVNTPITTFAGGTNWKQVSSGSAHTAAIKTDGTLWTWGNGFSGQLGTNISTSPNRSTPVTTFAGGNNWKQVIAGNVHTAAIKTDGTLWTWGNGSSGQLGNANTTNRSTPVTTFAGGNNWKQVIAGSHTAAIKTDGTLWTWGAGSVGQLGNAQTTNVSTPVTTFAGGTNWKQVSGGGNTAAIKTDGTLWTWGNNAQAQLGNNNSINVSTPVTTFAGGTNWKQVSATGNHTAAIKTDGTLWIWGNGSYAKLGNADITNRSTPVTTFAGGTNWKQVSLGDFHTVAIKTDGTLWTWGRTTSGRLGNAAVAGNVSTPVTTFAGGSSWKQSTASLGGFTMAIKEGINAEYPLS